MDPISNLEWFIYGIIIFTFLPSALMAWAINSKEKRNARRRPW